MGLIIHILIFLLIVAVLVWAISFFVGRRRP